VRLDPLVEPSALFGQKNGEPGPGDSRPNIPNKGLLLPKALLSNADIHKEAMTIFSALSRQKNTIRRSLTQA
jgi:hypothetical protein